MSALFPPHSAGLVADAERSDVAIVDTDRSWTHAEVVAAIAPLVADLAGGDGLIAVLTPRDATGVLGVLAAAWTGRPFLAVDVTLPPARQAQLIGDSGATTVLVPAELADAHPGAVVITADRPGACAVAGVDLDPRAAAYLVYTSGTTGTPKGVLVTHGGLACVSAAQQAVLDLGPGARVLQAAAVSFDAYVFELMMAFGSGGTLVLPGARAQFAGPAMAERMREQAVTHLVATPTALGAMDATGLTDLRVVCSVGERCTPAVRDRWRPGRRLLNLYGPAEASIWATYAEMAATADPAGIGHPIPGVRAYVLDDRRRPVPDGEDGQLYLAGPTVALGYAGRPEATAERFVADPAGTGLMYATGDRVRRGADGALSFVGRVDDQVKIQGARVEPAEVQAVLRAVPGVGDAVVVAADDTGATVLVAAYTGDAEPDRVARAARAALPRWMVPSRIVRLATIPLSANGKADRAAIGRLALAAPRNTATGPRTPLDELIVREAGAVLDRSDVTPADDFFALGGNSMLALRLTARVGDTLGRELDLAKLLAAGSLAAWSQQVEADLTDGRRSDRPPVRPADPHDTRPSVGQSEILAAERYLGGSAAYVTAWCDHVTGPFDADRFVDALHQVAAVQETLRTRFTLDAAGARAVVDPDPVIAVTRESADGVATATALVEAHCREPMRLDREQPLRAHIVRIGAQEHLVTVVMHHVACDAASFHILLGDVWDQYTGVTPPPPAAPYRDFAAWQHEFVASPAGDAQRDWWGRRLRGLAPLRIGDRDATAGRTGRRLPVTFPHAGGIEALCTDLRISPFTVLSAAYALALAPYASDRECVIGTPVTARGARQFDHTYGYFVSMVPVPLPIVSATASDTSIGEWLRAWAATCVELVARRDLPLAEISRAWARTSTVAGRLATVFALNYVPAIGASHRRRVRLDAGPMKYDLLFTVDIGPLAWTGELAYDGGVQSDDEAHGLLDGILAALDAFTERLDEPVSALVAPTGVATFDFGALL